jgi:hypothetical protein
MMGRNSEQRSDHFEDDISFMHAEEALILNICGSSRGRVGFLLGLHGVVHPTTARCSLDSCNRKTGPKCYIAGNRTAKKQRDHKTLTPRGNKPRKQNQEKIAKKRRKRIANFFRWRNLI